MLVRYKYLKDISIFHSFICLIKLVPGYENGSTSDWTRSMLLHLCLFVCLFLHLCLSVYWFASYSFLCICVCLYLKLDFLFYCCISLIVIMTLSVYFFIGTCVCLFHSVCLLVVFCLFVKL